MTIGATFGMSAGVLGIAAADPATDTTTVEPGASAAGYSATYVIANDDDTKNWINSNPNKLNPSMAAAYALTTPPTGLDGGNIWFCAVSNGHTAPSAMGGLTYGTPKKVSEWAGSVPETTTTPKVDGAGVTAKKAKVMKEGSEDYGAIAYLNSIANLPTNLTSKGLQHIKVAQEVISETLSNDDTKGNGLWYKNNKADIDKIVTLAKQQRGPYKLFFEGNKTPKVEDWADGTKHLTLPAFKIMTATGKELDTAGVSKIIDPTFTGNGIHTVEGRVHVPKSIGSMDNVPAENKVDDETYRFNYTTGGENEIEINLKADMCSGAKENSGITVSLAGLPSSEIFVSMPNQNPENNNALFKNAHVNSDAGAQPLFQLGLTAPGKMDFPLCKPGIELKTIASWDKVGGEKDIAPGTNHKAFDVVEYKNLEKDKPYTLKAKLIDTKDDTVIKETTHDFHAKDVNGKESVEIGDIPAEKLVSGAKFVVYEYLYQFKTENLLAKHEDKTDTNQTLTVSAGKLKTTATDKADNDKIIESSGSVIADKVEYEGVTPGDYTATGRAMLIRGDEIPKEVGNASEKVTISESKGAFTMNITLNTELKSGDKVVVFEELTNEKNEVVATHRNPKDENQTVTVGNSPKIHTQATWANGQKLLPASMFPLPVVDKVSYEGLVPGQVYTLVGTLHDVSAAQQDLATFEAWKRGSGSLAPAIAQNSVVFNAGQSNGTQELALSPQGATSEGFVVFEELYKGQIPDINARQAKDLVATHSDPNDQEQIVMLTNTPPTTFSAPPQPPANSVPNLPKTGSSPALGLAMLGAGLFTAGLGMLFLTKKRRFDTM